MQKSELYIVYVEDVPAEAALVETALRKSGLEFSLHCVDTQEAFLSKLAAQPPDVILSDHGLPSFDGFSALAIAHKRFPEVPFIFVTNALNREMEIEKLAPGVTDYVQKQHLSRLGPVIRRALEAPEPGSKRPLNPNERERIIAKLLALLAMYDYKGIYLPICAGCKQIRDRQNQWQPPEVFFKKHLGFEFSHGLCPKCNDTFYGPSGE